MVSTPKANGFADHYPYEKWLAIIGNIPYFQTNPNRLVVLDSGHHRILLGRINIADQLIPSSCYEPLPQIL